MARALLALLVAVWRRVVYCRRGHAYMFSRTADGLSLVCPRCLASRRVIGFRSSSYV